MSSYDYEIESTQHHSFFIDNKYKFFHVTLYESMYGIGAKQ